MRIIGDINIPFLKYRWYAICASLVVILAGLALEIWGPGFNLGIDFVGGSQVTVKFREPIDISDVRDALAKLESGTPSIQRFDEAEKNQILIRVENPESEEGDFTAPILELLRLRYNHDLEDKMDLNVNGSKAVTELLATANPDGVVGDPEERSQHYLPMAEALLELRRQNGLFVDHGDLDSVSALSDPARDYLKAETVVGAFSLLSAESVGPSVGADLREQAVKAIFGALIGMLIYIWVRFRLPFSLGAVTALFHDVLITLSALSLTGREITLPTIAALLTLVGYSVNDSVVVFDRVRENLRNRPGEDLERLMNTSINQTLSRTLITSGTTLAVVITLYLFGGDVINTFAFVLLVGFVVGTYSSIFIASPVALFVSRLISKRRRSRGRR